MCEMKTSLKQEFFKASVVYRMEVENFDRKILMIRKYQHLVNSPSYHMLQGPVQSLAGMQIKLVTCPFS